MTIGERIKDRRIELGMTQEELAYKVGYKSRASINKIELGRDGRLIKMSKLPAFADALQWPIDYLMGWENDPDIIAGKKAAEIMLDDSVMDFVDKYKQLNDSNQAAVRTMVDVLLVQQNADKT